ncbi:MAG: hypothetical protein AB7Q81_04410 [Gammaproteobacteria bacterium]
MLAAFHRVFDLSVGLPGHFGVFWMAAIVFARAGSSVAFAGMLAAVGYAAGASAFGAGGHGVFNAPGYLVCAGAIDLAWWLSPALLRQGSTAALCGAVAFALKPMVLAVLVAALELQAGALRHGLGYVVLTHAAFGACGAAIGAVLFAGAMQPPRTAGR